MIRRSPQRRHGRRTVERDPAYVLLELSRRRHVQRDSPTIRVADDYGAAACLGIDQIRHEPRMLGYAHRLRWSRREAMPRQIHIPYPPPIDQRVSYRRSEERRAG